MNIDSFDCTLSFTFGLDASFKSRANFTEYHLLSAQNSYNLAVEVENSITLLDKIDELQTYMAHVSTCIMCSVAAIESKVNEYTIDNEDQIDKINISKNYRGIDNYSNTSSKILRSTCIIDKYEMLWLLANKAELPEDNFGQNIRYLSQLRNALTHFTPEWTDELNKHANLEKNRKNRFSTSKFYPKDAIFFPYQCLSSECAKWAINTCNEALERFPKMY